jgi:uncharacterized protein
VHAEGTSTVARAALEEARAIVRRELAGLPVEVYLFGSRATGTASVSSDLDIGVLPTGPVPSDTLARLRETFEDSTIPYEVDVVDLSRVTPAFRERVQREGQRWVG